MKKKLEIIKTIDSLLKGEHNLTSEQRINLTELRIQTKKSKSYGDLKTIGLDIVKIVVAYFKSP